MAINSSLVTCCITLHQIEIAQLNTIEMDWITYNVQKNDDNCKITSFGWHCDVIDMLYATVETP